MRNSAVKRIIAVLLCLVVFAGSELTGLTNIVGDLFAEETTTGTDDSDRDNVVEDVEVEAQSEEPQEDTEETVEEEPEEDPEPQAEEDTAEETVEPETEEPQEPQEIEADGEDDVTEEENKESDTDPADTEDDGVSKEPVADKEDKADTEDGKTEENNAAEETDKIQEDAAVVDDAKLPAGEEQPATSETVTDPAEENKTEQKPEDEEEPEAFEEEYQDGQVVIHVAADPGVVPNGTELSVKKIVQQDVETLDDEEKIKEAEELNAKYEGIKSELELTVADDDTKEIAGFVAYDVNFLLTDEDGETTEIEPDGEVSVSMEFEEAYLPEEIAEKEDQIEIDRIDVIHMEEAEEDEESETGLKSEVVADADVSTTENAVEKAEFTTDSGRTFVITWTENDLGEREYVCETEDATIKVTAAKGVVPDGALLKVVPILANNEATQKQYQDVEKKLLEKAETEKYEIAGFLAYDISFTDEAGAKLEPNGEVKVAIDYKKAAIPEDLKDLTSTTYALDDTEDAVENDTEQAESARTTEEKATEESGKEDETSGSDVSQSETPEATGNITVMHLEENDQGQVTKVVDMGAEGKVTELNSTKDQKITSTEFVTESFSTFTIVWTTVPESQRIEIGFYRFGEDSLVENDIQINDLILTTKNEDGSDKKLEIVTLNNGEYFDVTEISEEGRWKDYYQLKDNDNNLYVFNKAKAIMTYLGFQQEESLRSFGYENNNFYYYDVNNNYGNFTERISYGWNIEIRFYYLPIKELKTADTIDNQDFGITMRMIDYVGHEPQKRVMGDKGLFDKDTNIKYGIVDSRLGDDGYPKMVQGNAGKSLKELFEPGNQSDIICKDANNLFLSDTYETTGYLNYSSFENYAFFDQNTGNFKVYEGIGAPNGDDINVPEQNRGNFLPYNDITGEYWPNNKNFFDGNGNRLDPNADRYGEPLYKPTLYEEDNVYETQLTEDWNKCFGMYMETVFVQPQGGEVEFQKENGEIITSDMIYEFNGDDDLWVFIDGTLVLDIGGSHAARLGTINFATGDVIIIENGKENKKTLKGLFDNLKIFPDGTTWDDSKVDNYFNGNTFADNTQHRLKMFYMEHGGGASDLYIKMNLSTVKIPKGAIEVEKQLSNTDKEKYKDVEFAFQVFAQKIKTEESENQPETYYEEEYVTLSPNQFLDEDGKSITGKIGNDNIFYLKPGETARFNDLQDNRKYYVKEIGVNSAEYDKVTITGTSVEHFDNQGGSTTSNNISSSVAAVGTRPRVVYTNECSAQNSRKLRITKQMAPGQSSDDTFTFKVTLGEKPFDGKYTFIKSNGTKTENQASAQGEISGVAVGDIIEIDQIMSDTIFKVEEVNPETDKYTLVGITGKSGTYTEVANTEPDSKALNGKILLGQDAEVTVTNALKNVQTSGLSITKKLKAGSPDTNASFEFKVYQKVNGEFGLYTGEYSVGSKKQTTTDGIISIQANETATIEMPAGTQFKVEETLSEGYGTPVITLTENTATVTKIDGNMVEGTVSEGQYAGITVTNVPAYSYDWQIIKKGTAEGSKPLEGAEFTLASKPPQGEQAKVYYGKSQKDSGVIRWFKDNSYKEDEVVSISDIAPGEYVLEETKAPTGYMRSNDKWEITLAYGSITVKDSSHAIEVAPIEINGRQIYEYTFLNEAVYELPSTGGAGIFGYMISGVLLMMAGVLVLYKRKYAGRC